MGKIVQNNGKTIAIYLFYLIGIVVVTVVRNSKKKTDEEVSAQCSTQKKAIDSLNCAYDIICTTTKMCCCQDNVLCTFEGKKIDFLPIKMRTSREQKNHLLSLANGVLN